ncbi:4Fe-4S dicluster domain-containing protein [Brockia lithotrophica]|uniref:Formate dehydrogenase iron-sulfur subunit n=1 Tax=Brockia lithotrophica TaxID=933949 RepID=A0A660L5H6_9BACL|nr:formate dehydrogenase iron-sulfur subunit [Brockia lithotrophica]
MGAKGMLIDTSLCIGCKACQVACKEWNDLPMEEHIGFSGDSYDNTLRLTATTWRHVKFIEQFDENHNGRWLFLSDSCKHCTDAACMNVCPTGAIVRTEFGSVYVQEDVCIGCGSCERACPFGVIHVDAKKHVAQKCTLCYDRLQHGMQPACAQACPTDAIQFGDVDELRKHARERVAQLQARGEDKARVYGEDIAGGLNVFYILLDEPKVYGLPEEVSVPNRENELPVLGVVGAVAAGLVGLAALADARTDAPTIKEESE